MFESAKESSEIKDICVRLLSRREQSQKELLDKLANRGFERSEIQSVIDDLKEQGWQSDQRFAESYARHRIRKGFGPVKVGYELKQRGIQNIDLDDVLFELADDWFEILDQVYKKKYAENNLLTFDERVKRSRFLLHRGFSSEMIMKYFQNIENIENKSRLQESTKL